MEKEHEERWLPVVGYEGWYDVSDLGRVKRIMAGEGAVAGRILSPGVNKKGYRNVVLYKNGKKHNFTVQRLVADAFLGLRPENLQRNHIDGNKSNNRLDNLEYITPSENMLHAHRTGLISSKGMNAHNRKLTEGAVHEIRRRLAEDPVKLIANDFNVSCSAIYAIKYGTNWGGLKEEDDDERT